MPSLTCNTEYIQYNVWLGGVSCGWGSLKSVSVHPSLPPSLHNFLLLGFSPPLIFSPALINSLSPPLPIQDAILAGNASLNFKLNL